MNHKGYLWGLPPLAWAIIFIIVLLLVVAFIPPVKNAILEIVTATK